MIVNASNNRIFLRNLLWISFAALILRILCALPTFLQDGKGFLRPDSYTYILPAKALIANHHYWTEPDSGIRMTKRPPGTSILLALPLIRARLIPFAVLGCFLSAFSCFPVGMSADFLFGKKAGYLAATLYALNLTSIAQAPMILADSALGFCCAWACFETVLALKKKCVFHFAAACLLLGFGAWFKPVNLPALLLGMPILAIAFFGFTKKTFAAWGTILLTFLLLLFPVMLANYRAGAEFDMDSNRGEMYYHSGSAILGIVTGENTGLIRERMMRENEIWLNSHNKEYPTIRARNAYNHKKYVELIKKYPVAFLQTHLPQWAMLLPDFPTFLENNNLTMTGRGTLDIMRQYGVFTALDFYLDGRYYLLLPSIPFLFSVLMLYLGAFGTLLLWIKKWHWRELLFFGVFVFYYLFAGGPVTMPRYQIPALPFLCVMSAFYICLIVSFYRKNQTLSIHSAD